MTDHEQRGLLDETLVHCGSEFGRQPTAQGPDGRMHTTDVHATLLALMGLDHEALTYRQLAAISD